MESENQTDLSSNDINPSKARILKAFENSFIQSNEPKGKFNVLKFHIKFCILDLAELISSNLGNDLIIVSIS